MNLAKLRSAIYYGGFLILALLLNFPKARAACSVPTAQAGAIEYFTGTSQYKLCDGTTWSSLNMSTTSLGSCPTTRNKARKYDSNYQAVKICDGTNYKKVNCVSGTGGSSYSFCGKSAQKILTPLDAAASDRFGQRVVLSVDGSTALVGVPNKAVGANTTQGVAYIFVRSGSSWLQQTKLTASDGTTGDQFGSSIALSSDGNTALVGALFKNVGANTYQGASYIFTRSGSTWTEQAKLTASDGVAYDTFGNSAALSSDGNTALIGAFQKTVGANSNQGAAYVYTRSGSAWTQQVRLTASDGAGNDFLGGRATLSSDGNTALVAAANKNIGANLVQGAAYVYTRSGSTWTQQARLTATDGAGYDSFGDSVTLSNDGNTSVIGASGKNIGAITSQGAAYVYTRSGSAWTQQVRLTASDGAANDTFGAAASLSSDGVTVLISAPGKTVGSNAGQGAAYVFTGSAATWTQQAKLTSFDGANSDNFGASVALSSDGKSALIGANFKTVNGNSQQGVVYILSGWQLAKLLASDGAASDYFGYSAALSSDGNTALVAAYSKTVGANSSQGAVYVYIRAGSAWTQQTKITAADATAGDFLGSSVSLSSDGNTALIGAYQKSIGANASQGAAYIFIRSGTTWSQQARLTSADGTANDYFGSSVSLSGDGNTALIGARYKAFGASTQQGSGYVFTRSGTTWSQQSTLVATDAAANDQFGISVSLASNGNTALVGAQGKASAQGATYVFTRSGTTWSQLAKLTAADGVATDNFGSSVALSGDGSTALIGAAAKVVGANSGQGAAYVFNFSGAAWAQQSKFTASDGAASDRFGFSASLSSDGNTALIGSDSKIVGANNGQGAAYVFTRSGSTWIQQARHTASDGTTGDYFGTSVAISSDGNSALMGASQKMFGASNYQGAAYVFATTYSTSCSQTITGTAGLNSGKGLATAWTAVSNLSLSQGDTLLVCAATLGSISGITWNGSALSPDITNSAVAAHVGIYSIPNVTAGTGNIVVTTAASSTSAISVMKLNNLTTNPFDKSGSATGTSTTPSSTLSATTTQAAEFIYSCASINGPTADTAGSWTNLTGGQHTSTTGGSATSNIILNDASQVVSSTGTFSGSMTGITSRVWASVTASYKISAPPVCQTYGACSTSGKFDYVPANGMRYCDGQSWRQMLAP